MTPDPQLIAARARCVAARERFDTSVAIAKTRLNPKALASEAVDGVRSRAGEIALDGVDAVRARPGAAAAVAGVLALALAHKPLGRWFAAMFGRGDATADRDAS